MECAHQDGARKFQAVNGKPERYRLITFEGAFHGRTLATIGRWQGSRNISKVSGRRSRVSIRVPLGDLEAVKKAISGPQTAGIIIEPLQGEWRRARP